MSANEAWYLKTPDGDVDRMTLDQIDEAFNAGRIDGSVMVLPPDGSRWARLAELAGIDSDLEDRASRSPTSLRPVSIEATDELMASLARRKPRLGLFFGAAVGVVALVAGGVAIKNSGLLKFIRRAPATHVVAVAPPPPPVTTVAAPPAPPPQVSAAAAQAPSSVTDATQAATADTTTADTTAANGKHKADKKSKATKKKKQH